MNKTTKNENSNNNNVYLFEEIDQLISANSNLKRSNEAKAKINDDINSSLNSLISLIEKIEPDFILTSEQANKIQPTPRKFKSDFENFLNEYEGMESLLTNEFSDIEELAVVLSQYGLNIKSEFMRILPLEFCERKNEKIITPKYSPTEFFTFDNKMKQSDLSNIIKREVPTEYKNNYWRAIVYSYLESLILENQVYALKQLILDLYDYQERLLIINTICQNQIKEDYSFKQVSFISSIKILMLIANCLDESSNENILTSYTYLIKSLIYSRMFDLSLILFFQTKCCEYIATNKDHVYNTKNNTFASLFLDDDLTSSTDLITELYFKLISGKTFSFNLLIPLSLYFNFDFNIKVGYNIKSTSSLNNEIEIEEAFFGFNNECCLYFLLEVDCKTSNNLIFDIVIESKMEDEIEKPQDKVQEKQEENLNSAFVSLKDIEEGEGDEILNIKETELSKKHVPVEIEDVPKKKKILIINSKEYKEANVEKTKLSIYYPEFIINKYLEVLSTFSVSLGSFKIDKIKKIEKEDEISKDIPIKIETPEIKKSKYSSKIQDNLPNENMNTKINLVHEKGVCLVCKKLVILEQENILNCCHQCIESKFNTEILFRYLNFLNLSHKCFIDEDTANIPHKFNQSNILK